MGIRFAAGRRLVRSYLAIDPQGKRKRETSLLTTRSPKVQEYPFASAEDRATLGSDPSADWSPANGRSGGFHTKTARLAHCRCREKSDKSIFLLLHQIALKIGGDSED
jgi:hypothetical protein